MLRHDQNGEFSQNQNVPELASDTSHVRPARDSLVGSGRRMGPARTHIPQPGPNQTGGHGFSLHPQLSHGHHFCIRFGDCEADTELISPARCPPGTSNLHLFPQTAQEGWKQDNQLRVIGSEDPRSRSVSPKQMNKAGKITTSQSLRYYVAFIQANSY